LPENRRLLLETRMRLALAQLNFTVGAFEQNFAKFKTSIARAKAVDADLVVFSETAATGEEIVVAHEASLHATAQDIDVEKATKEAELDPDRKRRSDGHSTRRPHE
jgi:predicted amidohydrolase